MRNLQSEENGNRRSCTKAKTKHSSHFLELPSDLEGFCRSINISKLDPKNSPEVDQLDVPGKEIGKRCCGSATHDFAPSWERETATTYNPNFYQNYSSRILSLHKVTRFMQYPQRFFKRQKFGLGPHSCSEKSIRSRCGNVSPHYT